MMQKPIIYYDNMMSPTYIRLVSDRLNLDHIVYTEANGVRIPVRDLFQPQAGGGLPVPCGLHVAAWG